MSAPVESKVTAASLASLVASFVVGWIVVSAPALESLAGPLQALILGAVTTALTFVTGWLTKHTPRPPEPRP